MVSQAQFDVFLAHNSLDKPQVKEIAQKLKQRGLQPWLDEEQIRPGKPFQDEIQQAIPSVKSAAIFFGVQGLGAWQSWELRALISQCVKNKIPVIPVLLPGVNHLPEDLVFLKEFRWINFSTQIDEEDVLDLLEWGITGQKPQRNSQSNHEKPGQIPTEESLQNIPQTNNYSALNLYKIFNRGKKTFLISLGLTTLVVILRILGVFQNSELSLFDQMMRLPPPEKPDSRLLLVKITPEDIQHYAQGYPSKNGASLSDEIVYKLLSELLNKKPKVIGVDLYRYAKAEGELTKLIHDKQTDKRLVFICKFPDDISNKHGGRHNPPPDVPLEQVGLSDFIFDRDKVIRRQLIQMGTPTTEDTGKSTCRNPKQDGLMNSFSLQVAQKYLNNNMKSGFSVLKPFNTILEPLNISKQGGYNLKNLDGYQIMLNYRYAYAENNPNSHSVSNIALQFTVQQVLEEKIVNESFVKDKIVLIGTTAEGYDGLSSTPFSNAGPDQAMQGLFIQAQMVSQLVSAVEDNRPLIKVCSLEWEILWILFWSLIGASLPQLCKQPRKLIILGIICIGSLYLICVLLFISPIKFWISFYPSVLVFISTGIMLVLLEFRDQNKDKIVNLPKY